MFEVEKSEYNNFLNTCKSYGTYIHKRYKKGKLIILLCSEPFMNIEVNFINIYINKNRLFTIVLDFQSLLFFNIVVDYFQKLNLKDTENHKEVFNNFLKDFDKYKSFINFDMTKENYKLKYD